MQIQIHAAEDLLTFLSGEEKNYYLEDYILPAVKIINEYLKSQKRKASLKMDNSPFLAVLLFTSSFTLIAFTL